MKTIQSQQEWLHDVTWSWDGTSTTRGKAGARSKFKAYALTMTHNPTGIRVMTSTPYVQNKRELTQIKSSKVGLDLFNEIQEELARRDANRELEEAEQAVASDGDIAPV